MIIKKKYFWFITCAISLIVIIFSIVFYKQALEIREGITKAKVSFRLNWIPDPTFTGAYVAKSRSQWKNQNLEVSIKPGGMNIDPIRLVDDGTDQFGVVGANRLLQARAEGYRIVAICVEMQTHPVGWIVRHDSPIQSFKDFEGHRIGLKVGDESETIMNAVFNKLKISLEKVTLVPVGFSPNQFITGKVDALPVYINEEPHTVSSKGISVRILHPSAEGISLYGNVIFTNEDMINNKIEIVQKFVSGLLEGWQIAKNEPSKNIANELIEIEPDMANVPTEKVLVSTLELVFGSLDKNKKKLGWMDLERWENSLNILEKFTDIELKENLATVFTNSFVEKYYADQK